MPSLICHVPYLALFSHFCYLETLEEAKCVISNLKFKRLKVNPPGASWVISISKQGPGWSYQ